MSFFLPVVLFNSTLLNKGFESITSFICSWSKGESISSLSTNRMWLLRLYRYLLSGWRRVLVLLVFWVFLDFAATFSESPTYHIVFALYPISWVYYTDYFLDVKTFHSWYIPSPCWIVQCFLYVTVWNFLLYWKEAFTPVFTRAIGL